jgi:hypothetical protein
MWMDLETLCQMKQVRHRKTNVYYMIPLIYVELENSETEVIEGSPRSGERRRRGELGLSDY